jgi:hypothetical protein
MTVPLHFKFTARGIFTNTPETWSFSFKMTNEVAGGDDGVTGNIDAGAVTTAFSGLFSAGWISSRCHMTDWRAYEIGHDGHVLDDSDILVTELEDGDVSGSASNRYPPQIALVVSTIGDNRGPAQFGRFYLPGPAHDLQTDMRLSTTNADSINTDVTAFLKAVSDSIDLDGLTSSKGCNISSRGNGGAGTLQQIDHVETGRVLDTLRTRRNKLVEERQVGGQIDW